MSVKCPAGNVTHELRLRTHKKDKVINEECVKQRLILRKSVLHCENFKRKIMCQICAKCCAYFKTKFCQLSAKCLSAHVRPFLVCAVRRRKSRGEFPSSFPTTRVCSSLDLSYFTCACASNMQPLACTLTVFSLLAESIPVGLQYGRLPVFENGFRKACNSSTVRLAPRREHFCQFYCMHRKCRQI